MLFHASISVMGQGIWPLPLAVATEIECFPILENIHAHSRRGGTNNGCGHKKLNGSSLKCLLLKARLLNLRRSLVAGAGQIPVVAEVPSGFRT